MEASSPRRRDDTLDVDPGQLERATRRAFAEAGQSRTVVVAVTETKQEDGMHGLRIPEGWAYELLPQQPDHVILSTPSPGRYMATIDFRLRGFRTGYSTTGLLVGEAWNKRRKKYGGRGWKQSIVDDAVAHLREVLR